MLQCPKVGHTCFRGLCQSIPSGGKANRFLGYLLGFTLLLRLALEFASKTCESPPPCLCETESERAEGDG